MSIAESSNGKTVVFETTNEGSIPSSATKRNYHAEWYERNRKKRVRQIADRRKVMRIAGRKYVRDHLLTHSCVDCGENDPVVLDFDHVRGKKKAEVTKLAADGYTTKAIQAEIDKCDIRCANCHRRRHANERSASVVVMVSTPPL